MSPIRHLVEDFNSPTDLRVSRTPMNVRVLAQHLTLWTHEFTFQKTEVHKKPLWNEHVQWGKPWEDKASIKEEEKIERKDSASIIWWWLMVLRRAYSACHAILRTIQGFFLCVTNFRFPTPDQLLKIIGIKQPFHCKQYRLMTRLHHTVLSTMIRI